VDPAATPTACPLDCPDACGVLAETDAAGRLVRVRGNPAHSYSRGVLCGKTALYADLVNSPDRLRTPLLRGEPCSWETALAEIARRVGPLPGERILSLNYAGNMGLVARKFPLRVMHALGADVHDGGICDTAATAAFESVLGRCLGPDLEAIDDRDLVLLWGTDVARTVQHLQPALQRLCRRGTPVLAVDVYRTDTIEKLRRWGGDGIVLRPGTDAALALALARLAFERGTADRDFLARECEGAAAFEAHVRAGHDVAWASAVTGVPAARIEELAARLGAARRPLIKTGIGWTRRRNGGANMRAVCSLAAVLGRADDVHFESFAHFGLAEDVIERPDLRPPAARRAPVPHVQLGGPLAEGRYGAVFVWGHNAAITLPDSGRVRAGLARDDVFVVVHEQFLTETAWLADVVLPATTFVENTDVYRSYGHRVLTFGRRACAPPGEARSNVDAFRAIARALDLPRETWAVDEASLARELLEASRERIGDADLARLLAGEPVKLRPRALEGRGTPSGKVELVGELGPARWVPDDAGGSRGAFWLLTAPSKATHNTTFLHSPRHLRRRGPVCCHLHPEDAADLGVGEGDAVRLSNDRGSLTLPVAPTDAVPRGVVRVDGLPRAEDLPEGIGINLLTGPALADLGAGNTYYSTRVDVEAGGRALPMHLPQRGSQHDGSPDG